MCDVIKGQPNLKLRIPGESDGNGLDPEVLPVGDDREGDVVVAVLRGRALRPNPIDLERVNVVLLLIIQLNKT